MTDSFLSLLEQTRQGNCCARDAMYRLAFRRLRAIATCLLGAERAPHTLQPTALVSELFLKLQKLEARIVDEEHFFSLSARAMRQVLIDHGRRKRPARALSPSRVAELLQPASQSPDNAELFLSVKLAFEKLRSIDAVVADTVWRRGVEGLTIHEVSRRQLREEWRVRADYDFGLEWLANRLRRHS